MSVANITSATGIECRLLNSLPAELRIMIYEYALTHDRQQGVLAAVALLGTCKQIHNEATHIFYAHSTFTINAASTFDGRRVSTRNSHVGYVASLTGDIPQGLPDFTSPIQCYDALPSGLLRMRKVKLEITLSGDDQTPILPFESSWQEPIGSLLFAVTSFLNSSTIQHDVTLNISAGTGYHHPARFRFLVGRVCARLAPVVFLRHPLRSQTTRSDGTVEDIASFTFDTPGRAALTSLSPDSIAEFRRLRPAVMSYLSQPPSDIIPRLNGRNYCSYLECAYREIDKFFLDGVFAMWPATPWSIHCSYSALIGILAEKDAVTEAEKCLERCRWLSRCYALLTEAFRSEDLAKREMTRRYSLLCKEIGVYQEG